jgi:hypothetical protein
MNYLELVEKTWIKCGLAGLPPSSVRGQSDMAARIVAYVADAYRFVQLRHPTWKFHWRSAEGVLSPGMALYKSADFGILDFRLAKRVLLQSFNQWHPITIEDDASTYEFDNLGEGEPDKLAYTPSGLWLFNRLPLIEIPIRVEYYRSNHEFLEATDKCIIPDDFQYVVVWKAMEYYAHYDSDTALLQEAQREYMQMMGRLEVSQLEGMKFGAPALIYGGHE